MRDTSKAPLQHLPPIGADQPIQTQPSPELHRRFTYHPPQPDAAPKFTAIRQKAPTSAA
jgi:hypothetical protein